jgi:drug/metabolite transporter (DMT)-like permease
MLQRRGISERALEALRSPSRRLITAALALLCLVWGSTWAVIQIGLAGIPPLAGVSIRFAIAGVLLLLFAFYMAIPLGRLRKEWWLWLINGTLAFSASYGVVYWSEQWLPSGLTAILFATYPLFVAILAHFALPAESLRFPEVIGALLGFGGVAVIFSEDLSALGGAAVAMAAVVMMVSPIVSAVSSVAVKRWGEGVHPLSLTAIPMLLAAFIMGSLSLGMERDASFIWNRVSVAALLYLALFGSALTFTVYYWLLSHLPVKKLALIAYIIPIEAVVIGIFRGEPMTLKILAGSALVVFGVALAVTKKGSSLRWSLGAAPNV